MPRTRVKICGVCSPNDASLAASLGADAIGLIFHPASKRYLDLPTARAIVAVLPAFVTPIALFVDATLETINQTTSTLNIHHIQLQGNETPDFAARLPHLKILKALKTHRATLSNDITTWSIARLPNLLGFVLDTPDPHGPGGGTGIENDWTAIQDLQRTHPTTSIIAAGGLTSDNVASVIRLLHPHAVDLCSGVESSPRHKSPEKLAAFFAAVHSGNPI